MDSPTVLCIGCSPQLLELSKAALASHGFCIETAPSGYAAMKMLEEALRQPTKTCRVWLKWFTSWGSVGKLRGLSLLP